ncbi:3-ketoacyl-CoA reductase [Dacryopinax primogenitus]|uniref:Very-long-chain 3-oxoacyl-CoA reductase n=1 Tax=Dacryopinax primogenitus (strain DJM 731) TaxID=1858805 RepID=M5FYT6_DACPD|nr:3-ketoacyl-CoA reductase [Dacryopinax primogenitus]EJT96662.1 3-ketoacyl-CoA reductase [Dacryopinax primogenitus]
MSSHHIRPMLYARPADILTEHPIVGLSLAALGGIVLSFHVLRLVRVLVQTYLVPGVSLKKFGAGKGAWAVVTGATDGIGREFALQLAGKGFNVFIASRSADKLNAVASEIEGKYNVKTKTHSIDFSSNDTEAYKALETALSGLEVTVLVNNVGKSYEMPTNFVEHALEEDEAIVAINILSVIRVTKMLLPAMVSGKKGLILNIGSFSGAFPSPMLSVYTGSKSFLQSWSQCLTTELAGTGVRVELVNTYFVVSNLSKIRRPSIIAPTAKAYVRTVLGKIGVPCGSLGRPGAMTPFWSHSIGDWLVQGYAPKGWLLGYINNMHKDIRRRAIRKAERLAKQQ